MQSSNLKEVALKIPWPASYHATECDTWISFLEQFLACNYTDYTVNIKQDYYKRKTDIIITFANIADATFFKLTKYN